MNRLNRHQTTFSAKLFQTACAAVLFAAALPAHALTSDRNQPIEIEADQGSLDQKNQTTVFSGNVVVVQGTLNLHASSVRVAKLPDDQQEMTATGNPVRFSQQLDNNKGTVRGQGNRVEYSSGSGVVKLIGNAKVSRDGDRAEGAVITYNTHTEVYTVDGSGAPGAKKRRVTVVIQPNR